MYCPFTDKLPGVPSTELEPSANLGTDASSLMQTQSSQMSDEKASVSCSSRLLTSAILMKGTKPDLLDAFRKLALQYAPAEAALTSLQDAFTQWDELEQTLRAERNVTFAHQAYLNGLMSQAVLTCVCNFLRVHSKELQGVNLTVLADASSRINSLVQSK